MDIRSVVGTGPFGRITAADVEGKAGIAPSKSTISAASAPASSMAAAPPPPKASLGSLPPPVPASVVPFTTMQVAVSKNMAESLSVPIFRVCYPVTTDALDALYEKRYGEINKQRLDRAILTFLQNFKKSYIGDQAMHSSTKLFDQLSKLVGLHDHLKVFNVVVGKIATNLKSYTQCKEVIDHTISLFLEMSSGYMTGKLLLKLDTIKFIISHHNKEHFLFLDEQTCFRSRTTFYYTIGSLIFMEDSLLKFKSSMEPLMWVFVCLESTPDAIFGLTL